MVLIKIRGQIYNLSMLSKAEFTPAGQRKGWTDHLKMRFIGCQLLVTGATARRLWSILESQLIDDFQEQDDALDTELSEPMTTRERLLVTEIEDRRQLQAG